MRARLLVVLVTLAALLPLTLSAQTRGNGRVPGISHTPQVLTASAGSSRRPALGSWFWPRSVVSPIAAAIVSASESSVACAFCRYRA